VTQVSEAAIAGAGTEAAETIARFADRELGTTVVGYDTPTFIAGRVSQIDLAVQLGFGWRHGPFTLADQLGPAWLARQLPDAELPRSLAAAVRAGRFFADSTNHTSLRNQETH
jgi:hypothetical protein